MSDLSSFIEIPDTGELKVCSKCRVAKPFSCYSNASGGNYLRSECKECNNELKRRRDELRLIHQVPGVDYKCPICNVDYEGASGSGGKSHKSPWVLDHDHISGNYRGYLCHPCNRFFDLLLQDNRLERIPKYIESYSKNVD